MGAAATLGQTRCRSNAGVGQAYSPGETMFSVNRHRLAQSVCLLTFLFCAPLTYSQQATQCKRACDSSYWDGVSNCYRSSTAYGEIRQCQDAQQLRKRTCKHQCLRPRAPEPKDCRRRCDRQYWDAHGICYQSSTRYRDIRQCDDLARKTKNQCTRRCPRGVGRATP